MRRFWPLLLGAILSIALLLRLFPQYHALTSEAAFHLDRAQIVDTARKFSERHGVNTAGWAEQVKVDRSLNQTHARLVFKDDPILRNAVTAPARVLLRAPNNTDWVELLIGPRGQVLFWKHKTSFKSGIGETPAGDKLFADFRVIAGPGGYYKPTAQAERNYEGYRYAWDWVSAQESGIRSNVELIYRDGKLVRAERKLSIASSLLSVWRTLYDSTTGFLITALVFLSFLSVILGAWVFFQKLLVRKDHLRWPARLVLILLIWAALWALSGANADFDNDPGTQASGFTVLFAKILSIVLRISVIYLFLGAGYALLNEETRLRWLGLHLAARGRFRSRRFGQEVLAGLLAGPLLVLPAILLAATGWQHVVYANLLSSPVLFNSHPLLISVSGFLDHDITTWLFLLIPLSTRWIRSSWVRVVLLAATGVIGITALRQPLESGGLPDIAAGAILLAGFAYVYSSFGVLAAWFASFSYTAVVLGLTLHSQVAPGLQLAGWQMAGIWVLFLILSAVLSLRGTEYDTAALYAEMQPAASELTRSQRQRLMAEFEVARKAQANMLPSEAPIVPGASLSAACNPALEVGGDFFDYPALADGRYGLCVADVSGKGVPAALYMTLSKGILAAAVRHTGDVLAIARSLNQHLHAQGRNRTFVTMALAAYDPESRELEYLRAGHNPILWYRAQTGAAEYVQPPGLGLGIASSLRFDPIASTQILRLGDGDVVVFYSDGLTEAMNRNSALFGEDRLKSVVEAEARTATADSLKDSILEAVRRFTAGAPPHDDLTLLVLRIQPNELR